MSPFCVVALIAPPIPEILISPRALVAAVVKVVLRYARPFWEEAESSSGVSFFSSDAMTFGSMWTLARREIRSYRRGLEARQPNALRGFRAMRSSRAPSTTPGDTFGEAATSPLCAHYHDWAADPYARGAYSYLKVGAGNAREVLASPLAPSLCFAGEAAASIEAAGTVSGAFHPACAPRMSRSACKRLASGTAFSCNYIISQRAFGVSERAGGGIV